MPLLQEYILKAAKVRVDMFLTLRAPENMEKNDF
jgi:hypothetical protein